VSAAAAATWARVIIIGALLWTLAGLAVAYAVDHIEGALAKEREALRVARDEQLKRVFLATISHELRTPLNGVLGMVDELTRTPLDDRQRRFVDVAGSSAKLLLSVINDVLDFSKMEAGKLELEKTELRPADVIAEVASMFARGAEEKGLDLRWEAAPDTRRALIGDPSRLRQILTNLLGNAVKFTRRGTIVVRATIESESERDVVLRVEVKDSGIGIDRDAQAKLFLPFSQVDASTTRQYGGSGLGLAICRGLIDQMGGTIGVTSEPEAGSTFFFTVPLGKSDSATALLGRPGHLLIVEDSDVNAEVAGGILHMAGHTFDRVADGLEAIEAVRRRRYDVVLMDCHLPELDGYGATWRIRALETAGDLSIQGPRRLSILALTASVAKEDLDRAIASGMDGYVTKPLEAGRLLAKIAEHMGAANKNEVERAQAIVPEPRRSVVDWRGALQRLQGNRELLERVTKQLVEGAPAEERRLKDAVQRRDLAAVRYAVHRLRGQAAAFDAAHLMAAIDDLMDAAAGDQWPATGDRLEAVGRELGRVVTELSRGPSAATSHAPPS
jgi:signal transduction histidine kinase/CheY-like chemotaxis protein/HPt (histidine-containing phosphotransfer) domain-containing protein